MPHAMPRLVVQSTASGEVLRRQQEGIGGMEMRAGQAVAAGALLAGPLAKRSEWLHSWNRRFCVLTTEELTWQSETALEGNSSTDTRSVRMHSGIRLVARDGVLMLQPSSDTASSLWFSAASEPELRVWYRTLRTLLDELDSATRIARLHVHENASRFCTADFEEMPHLGARNLRERQLCKPFYVCTSEQQRGQPAPARGAVPSAGASIAARAHPNVVLYLLDMPPSTASWTGEHRQRRGSVGAA